MNKIIPAEIPHRCSGFFQSLVVYQSKDGKETTEPTEALLDRFGNPVVLRCSPGEELIDACTKVMPRISLNPDDPTSRAVALSSISSFSEKTSFPQMYMDKFRVLAHAENSVSAFEKSLESLVQSEK